MNEQITVLLNKSTIESGNYEALMNEIRQSCSSYSTSDQNKIRDKFYSFLEDNSLKKTYERITILDQILLHKRVFTLKDIATHIRKTCRISNKTIYRVLDLLNEAGIIEKRIKENIRGRFPTTYFELKL